MALVHTVRQVVGLSSKLAFAAALACILLITTRAHAQVNAPAWWGVIDNDTVSLSFLFPQNDWPPVPDFSRTPAWYAGTTWTLSGPKTPQWAIQLQGHEGVWGITDGFAGEGDIAVRLDNQFRPNWIKHVWYQFDVYGPCCWESAAGDVATIFNDQYTAVDLSFGWKRVTGSFDVIPQPDWEKLTWTFTVEAAGKAAIDNFHVGARCELVPEPAAIVTLASSLLALVALARRRRQ